jgi:hypothetical protein
MDRAASLMTHRSTLSGFADDSSFHTDGPAAIASMQCIIHPAGNYLNWLGIRVHMTKSKNAGIDFATGATIATDSIQLNGSTFKTIKSHQAHKLLGVRISMTGDFTSKKEYVMCEMQQRLQALKANEMLTPTLKETSVKIGVVPIFRCGPLV